jgi:hypothetical protein
MTSHASWLNNTFLGESDGNLHINTICISYETAYMNRDMLRTTTAEIDCHNIRRKSGRFERLFYFILFSFYP